jgi:hypothetical protein
MVPVFQNTRFYLKNQEFAGMVTFVQFPSFKPQYIALFFHPICVFLKEKLHSLSPNFHIHTLSVRDLYISTIDRSTYFPAAE